MNRSHLEFLSSPAWAEMLETDLLPWIQHVGDLGDEVLEIGPGPGLTTELLSRHALRVTAIEVDPELARQLERRLGGSQVTVIHGDATATRLPDERFSTAACFSMLHHMPSVESQDLLFAEVHRLLRPGGIFVGVDSRDLEPIRAGHADDTFNPVPPETLGDRLSAVGLGDVRVELGDYQFRFVAKKPT